MENPVLTRSRIRKITGGFGFIPHAFNQQGYLKKLESHELLLYFFLMLVADKNGVSFYSDSKVCRLLHLADEELTVARTRLIELDLIAFLSPVYQVLELPWIQHPKEPPMLSKRDIFEIHQLFNEGYSQRKIAKRLGLSRNSIKKYLEKPEIAFSPRSPARCL